MGNTPPLGHLQIEDPVQLIKMYLLYLDESGTHSSARHFVLASVAVLETDISWAKIQLDRLQSQYLPDVDGSAHFHASVLHRQDGDKISPPFDQLDQTERKQLLNRLRDVAIAIRGTLFGVVIEKSYLSEGEDQYERALEQMLSRFDQFLGRRNREQSQQHLGLVVIAHSSDQKRLEVVLRQLATEGTQWGAIKNIVDIPFFRLSQNSRMLQVSDLMSNGVYGRYESSHTLMFDRMMPKFDQDERGRMHGLLHLTPNRASCYLPCCLLRRLNRTG